jgi:hypothetical protein
VRNHPLPAFARTILHRITLDQLLTALGGFDDYDPVLYTRKLGWTDDEIARFRALWSSHARESTIAKRLNRSLPAINSMRAKLGLPPRRRYRDNWYTA